MTFRDELINGVSAKHFVYRKDACPLHCCIERVFKQHNDA